jgi:MGT family glycosyltransferase
VGRVPSHIAFLPFPAYGHVNPTLPVVAELVRRGHRVTFATNDKYAAAVSATGAEVLRYHSTLADRALPERLTGEYLVHEPVRSIDEAIATLPAFEAGFSGDLPDLVAYDVSTFAAGRILARKWGRPGIELFPSFASNDWFSLPGRIGEDFADEIDREHPALVEFFVKQVALLTEHGLSDVSLEEFNAPADEFNLAFLAKSFQLEPGTFDERHAFVGPCLGERSGESEWRPPPADGKPLLLVTVGSVGFDQLKSFFRECVNAFESLPCHVVMSVGDQVDPAALGPIPENIEVFRWLPQLEVLKHAHAFVSHAGMNSTMEALYFGTPVVAVPHTPEQQLIAARVAELGLGIWLPRAKADADSLRAAVTGVLSDSGIRHRVRSMRDKLRATGGPTRAADLIEARLP